MQTSEIPVDGYERVLRAEDAASGLRAIIAVHDTTMGPSLGGLRMWNYESEDAARFDVLRLAKGMTYKSAVARTGLGGGKAVIIGDPKVIKSEALYLAMGRFIDSLDGLYITAEDVNTRVGDLEIIRRATRHVTGLSREDGGGGNPSPYTALGVFLGIKAACAWHLGRDDLSGLTVAVQGVGSVGSVLCSKLREAGAEVLVADRNAEKVEKVVSGLGCRAVPQDEVITAEADVFAPCALGAVINDETLPKLRCKIVAGCTNNPLLEARHGEQLMRRGILYAPDYVINAGGIINVAAELAEGGYDEAEALRRIERIPQALHELWEIAREENIPTSRAADRLAENILASARRDKQEV